MSRPSSRGSPRLPRGARPLRSWIPVAAASFALSACASLSPEGPRRDVAALVRARLQQHFDSETGTASGLDEKLDQLLQQPLDAVRAVDVALLASQELRAAYAELGISQAELAAARSPPNPRLEAHVRLPTRDASASLDVEGAVTVDLIGLLRNVPKGRLADARLQAVKIEVADRVLALTARTRTLFVELQTARRLLGLARSEVDLLGAAAELTRGQRAAGNISELEASEAAARHLEARLGLLRRESEVSAASARFLDALGMSPLTTWSIVQDMAPLPEREVQLEGLDEVALAQRLDVAARHADLEVAERRVRLAEWSVVPELRAGASLERDTSGETVIGPELVVEIPIFNWNRANIGREEAAKQQAEERLAAAETAAITSVHLARERLVVARSTVEHYRDHLLPLRRRALELAEGELHGMVAGPFAVFERRLHVLEAERRSVEALRDYWVARAELDRAVGGDLRADSPPPPSKLPE